MPGKCRQFISNRFTGPVAVVVGSEAEGVSDGLLEAAVKKVFIPMEGQAESLNAAVAAGMLCLNVCGNGLQVKASCE